MDDEQKNKKKFSTKSTEEKVLTVVIFGILIAGIVGAFSSCIISSVKTAYNSITMTEEEKRLEEIKEGNKEYFEENKGLKYIYSDELKEHAENYDIISELDLWDADEQTQKLIEKAFKEGVVYGSDLTVDIYNGEEGRPKKYRNK